MGNQHTKKKEQERAAMDAEALRTLEMERLQAQEAEAAAAELKVRATIRVTIHRLDGTVDEFVQALPKMRKGEAIQIIVTPEA